MTNQSELDHIPEVRKMAKSIKEYQGNKPTYRIDKEKGKYVIRKFVRFDHSWAEYSPPIATYESEAEANVAVEALYGKEANQ